MPYLSLFKACLQMLGVGVKKALSGYVPDHIGKLTLLAHSQI